MPFVLSQKLLCAAQQAYAIAGDGPLGSDGEDADLPGAGCVGWAPGWPVGFAAGDGDHDAGLVGRTAEGVILAFRGTRVPDLKPGMTVYQWLGDWLDNVQCRLERRRGVTGRVHTGFQGAVWSLWDEMAPQIRRAVAEADADRAARGRPGPAPLFVTGHSKGGGMAPFGAWLLADEYPGRQILVRTFAAPNFADAEFRAAYLPRVVHHVRYECAGDAIPHLPFVDSFFSKLPAVVKAGLNNLRGADAGYVTVGALSFIGDNRVIYADSPTVQGLRREAFLTALLTGRAFEARDRHVLSKSDRELYRVAQYQPCHWTT